MCQEGMSILYTILLERPSDETIKAVRRERSMNLVSDRELWKTEAFLVEGDLLVMKNLTAFR